MPQTKWGGLGLCILKVVVHVCLGCTCLITVNEHMSMCLFVQLSTGATSPPWSATMTMPTNKHKAGGPNDKLA
jgi:hypothetical protein